MFIVGFLILYAFETGVLLYSAYILSIISSTLVPVGGVSRILVDRLPEVYPTIFL